MGNRHAQGHEQASDPCPASMTSPIRAKRISRRSNYFMYLTNLTEIHGSIVTKFRSKPSPSYCSYGCARYRKLGMCILLIQNTQLQTLLMKKSLHSLMQGLKFQVETYKPSKKVDCRHRTPALFPPTIPPITPLILINSVP